MESLRVKGASKVQKTQMKRRFLLTALLLLLTGCQKEAPELAQKLPTVEEEVEENEANAISSVKKIVNAQFRLLRRKWKGNMPLPLWTSGVGA